MNDAMSAALARNWWVIALRGVFGILFGLAAFSVPGAVLLSLAWLFAIYLLADGIAAIIAAVRAAGRHDRWGLLLAEGIASILMGIVAFLFPAGAVLAFVIVTAVWALISGGMMLAASLSLHHTYGRVWLALGGIVSVLWGILLIIAPLLGALVLTWWLGAYALVFGVTLLILAFRLRGRHATGTI